jgi:phage terminase large subunit
LDDAKVMATENKSYVPLGAARSLFACKAREILIDGPAGTGKTRAVLEKCFLAALKYPGARILLVRKTRASMSQSVLVTLEDKVFMPNSPWAMGSARTHRESYKLPNGSVIIVAGLDFVEKLMSAEYDMIFCAEATECSEDDWEKLLTRLRNGKMPYQQAICDCNPSYPGHWLLQRSKTDKMKRFISRHEDNPSLTRDYLDALSGLTGHRRSRLYLGQWVAAEGLIYDRWDEAKFVVPRELSSFSARRVIGIDEGYTNPCSMHLYAFDNDGRCYVADEWYERGKLETEVVAQAKRWYKDHDVDCIVCDPSAAKLIAALEAQGLPVQEADNDVFGGIQACQKRIDIPGDGIPRLVVNPMCQCWIDEIGSYSWKENRQGEKEDKPEKTNDHAMDEWRYVTMYYDSAGTDMKALVI